MSSICFVSFYSGRLLLLGEHIGTGGAEVQQHILAQALRELGMRVSFVVGFEPETDGIEHKQYSVYRSYDRSKGLRFIKFIYPQFIKVWRALKRADSEYYYVRGMRIESGITWLYCLVHNRKYVAAIAHDRECRPGTLPLSRWNPKRNLFIVALKRAHQVFAQTSWQRASLAEEFGVKPTIIRNAMSVDTRYTPSTGNVKKVLWVGSIVPHKRPEIYLNLALKHPEMNFTMIGPLRYGLEDYRDSIKEQASSMPNMTFIDSVNFDDIGAFYRQCDLFVLTSNHEGFPNALLQAWSSGRPAVTSFDPDGIVAQNKLGYVAHDEEEIENVFRKIATGECASVLKEMGDRGRSYVEQFHSPSSVAGEIVTALGISAPAD